MIRCFSIRRVGEMVVFRPFEFQVDVGETMPESILRVVNPNNSIVEVYKAEAAKKRPEDQGEDLETTKKRKNLTRDSTSQTLHPRGPYL